MALCHGVKAGEVKHGQIPPASAGRQAGSEGHSQALRGTARLSVRWWEGDTSHCPGVSRRLSGVASVQHGSKASPGPLTCLHGLLQRRHDQAVSGSTPDCRGPWRQSVWPRGREGGGGRLPPVWEALPEANLPELRGVIKGVPRTTHPLFS